jgi:hypothetical protein
LSAVYNAYNPSYSGGDSQFKVSLGEVSLRSYLKNKLRSKELGAKIKW